MLKPFFFIERKYLFFSLGRNKKCLFFLLFFFFFFTQRQQKLQMKNACTVFLCFKYRHMLYKVISVQKWCHLPNRPPSKHQALNIKAAKHDIHSLVPFSEHLGLCGCNQEKTCVQGKRKKEKVGVKRVFALGNFSQNDPRQYKMNTLISVLVQKNLLWALKDSVYFQRTLMIFIADKLCWDHHTQISTVNVWDHQNNFWIMFILTEV